MGLVLGLVKLDDAKGIGVAQPIWMSSCPTEGYFTTKNAFLVFLAQNFAYIALDSLTII